MSNNAKITHLGNYTGFEKETSTYRITLEMHPTSNRSGFSHNIKMWLYDKKNQNYQYVNTKIHYLNRTWERFRYESVIEKALDKALPKSKDKTLKKRILKSIGEVGGRF